MTYAIMNNGKVIDAPVNLRSRYNNIGGFHTLTDEQRKAHGWYPCDVLNESFDPRTASRNPPVVGFDGERVTLDYQIIPKTLDQVKSETGAKINTLRDQKETEGFQYMGHKFQSDERSAARIFGAVQSAQAAMSAGVPFAIEWAAADNTIVPLDAAQTIGMSAAMATQANALHQYGRTLKDQVNAAATVVDVIGIDIETGWPE